MKVLFALLLLESKIARKGLCGRKEYLSSFHAGAIDDRESHM